MHITTGAQAADHLLEKLWPRVFSSLQTLVWLPTAPMSTEAQPYAKALCQLLEARLSQFETTEKGKTAYDALVDEVKRIKADLVICRAQDCSLFRRLVTIPVENLVIDMVPTSVLLPIKPRWPLKRILLAIRDQDYDETAVSWIIRLAKPSSAFVTVMPVITPAPPVFSHMKPSLPTLLNTDCPLGRKLRWIPRRLAEWKIESTIILREEVPDDQIRNEAYEGNHDLIVIAAEPHNQLRRWLTGELIPPLLSWVDRPILIAKPKMTGDRK